MDSPYTVIKQEDHVSSTLETPQGKIYKREAKEPASIQSSDAYEETDECDLECSGQTVWLVKLPHFIRERWGDIPSDSDEEIELGTVMVNKTNSNNIKIILSDAHDINKGLPRVYDLKNSSQQRVDNTFVFTEKDTKKRKRTDEQDGFPEIPARLRFKWGTDSIAKTPKFNEAKVEGKPLFSHKTEQHPTAVVGTVIAEMQMQPTLNSEYSSFQREIQTAAKKQDKIINISYNPIKDMLNPGTTGFVTDKKSLRFAQPSSNRSRTSKAYRAPKEEIQTKIFSLFEKYEYYPTKTFVEKLCQPEAYIREILEDIANYSARGQFSGNWCLKSEYKRPMAKSETHGMENQ